MSKKDVIIIGSSIGGLISAFELSKKPEYNITIIEKNNYLGGNSIYINNNIEIDNILSWHIISNTDKYLLSILNELTDEKGIKIISHLLPIDKFLYILENTTYTEYTYPFFINLNNIREFRTVYKRIYNEPLPYRDYIRMCYIVVYANSICEKQLQDYDSILWKDYIHSLSDNVKKWILLCCSIYMNINYDTVSVFTIFKSIRKDATTNTSSKSFIHKYFSIDNSIKTLIYDPLKKILEERGVKIVLNNKVVKIYYIQNLTTISTIETLDKSNNYNIYRADIFINAIGIRDFDLLYPKSIASSISYNTLYEVSKHNVIRVYFYIPYKGYLSNINQVISILPDSRWLLSVHIKMNVLNADYNYCILACNINVYDRPGINGKHIANCTDTELATECWAQINSEKRHLNINEDMIYDFFNVETSNVIIKKKTISNTLDTMYLRPDYVDKTICNLYHATSYVNTDTHLYNIEGACESGYKVAELITNKVSLNKINKSDKTDKSDKSDKTNKTNSIYKCLRFCNKIVYNTIKFCKI